MKKILLIFAVALAFVTSSCKKEVDPIDEPTQIHFSILGDSYSTFEGYVDPETNDLWYYYAEIGVTNVEQMWWWQVADSTGWLLERNNSFSGSLICNFDDFVQGDHYSPYSFIRRMDNLGNPDVIFILGGSNDVWKKAPFGDYVYSDWTEEQLCTFRPAMAYLLDNVKQLYPHAKIYYLLDTNPFPGDISEENRLNYVESTHVLTNRYGIECIDLSIYKSWSHPNVQGQKDIADQVLEVLRVDFNV